ncbi:hypothetical protein [Bacteroides intestinalis]|uniref:hypothetical protein n=1 Tax=Bacteroides intestinalis TaxID=329854 RepID=UPI001EDC25C3|nr:hypothetical protein [Bacteroides intestinalis]
MQLGGGCLRFVVIVNDVDVGAGGEEGCQQGKARQKRRSFVRHSVDDFTVSNVNVLCRVEGVCASRAIK